ncbi:hypothetical protein PG994_014018 [Apiospora phragmitis]|uniref:Uncharacterized protein n=1 Tax=Apiospora phragmitis TaxID=2905665 RepID=A0ABR1T340_9PEZI
MTETTLEQAKGPIDPVRKYQDSTMDLQACNMRNDENASHKRYATKFYRHFLTPDHGLVFHPVEDNLMTSWYEPSILQINQQIRAEAWGHLIRANLWVHVTVAAVDDCGIPFILPHLKGEYKGVLQYWLAQPYFPSDIAPAEYSARIASEAAVSLWLGETCGSTNKANVDDGSVAKIFMFAYNPRHYDAFVQELGDYTDKFKGLKIRMSSATLPGSSRFAKLVEPLCTLRDLENVWFPGVADCPALPCSP